MTGSIPTRCRGSQCFRSKRRRLLSSTLGVEEEEAAYIVSIVREHEHNL